MLPILTYIMQRNAVPLAAPTDSNHEHAEQAGYRSMELTEVTHDDVTRAFRTADFRDKTDGTLLAYLQLFCSARYAQTHEQLRANSRCIRLNAELMSSHARRISRQTPLLAAVAVLLAFGQLIIVLMLLP
jgi:hypothetical protein